MMHAVDREELRRDYDSRADHICEKVYQLCFDKTRGMLREGPNFEQFSQHSQALAVLCGALTGEEAKIAMEKALTEPDVLACTFPWQYTLLRALEKIGLYDLTAPLWAQYFSMLDRDLTTVPERPGDTRSDCHAGARCRCMNIPECCWACSSMRPAGSASASSPMRWG